MKKVEIPSMSEIDKWWMKEFGYESEATAQTIVYEYTKWLIERSKKRDKKNKI